MNHSFYRLSIAFLISTLLAFSLFQACKSDSTDSDTPELKSAVENSFDEVTAHLDKGGEFYLYASSERLIAGLEKFSDNLRKIIIAEITNNPGKPQILAIYDFVVKVLKDLGLNEISGIGISSIAIEKDLNHSKIIFHHYKDKGKGLIWQILDPTPHDLKCLELLPSDTVIACFGDFKWNTLWQWIKKEANESNLPPLQEAINSVEPALLKSNIDLPQLLDSMNGYNGFILQLSSRRKTTIPIQAISIEIPEPSMAIIFQVKNDNLFNLIKQNLPAEYFQQNGEIKQILLPAGDTPFNFKPVIVSSPGLFIAASNTQLVDDILAAQKNQDGLITTDEFKHLSKYIPTEGNAIRFVSSRFFSTFIHVQKKMIETTGNPIPPSTQMIFDLYPENLSLYGVLQNTPQGTIFTVNHSMSVENLFIFPAVIVTGVTAAFVIPQFISSDSHYPQKTTTGDLRSISNAIESYITDYEFPPEAKSITDLKSKLEPFYIKSLPLQDAWGNDFLYIHGQDRKKENYAIASPGKDGIFNGWNQQGFYPGNTPDAINNDIIFVNGSLVYGPLEK